MPASSVCLVKSPLSEKVYEKKIDRSWSLQSLVPFYRYTKCSALYDYVRFTCSNMSVPSRIVPALVNHLSFFFPSLVFIYCVFRPLTSSFERIDFNVGDSLLESFEAA